MAPDKLFNPDTMNAPWGLDSRLKLVALACNFFNANNIPSSHDRIGKKLAVGENPAPLTLNDFIKYLNMTAAYSKTPNVFRVVEIIRQMASTGLLVHVGYGSQSFAGLNDHFLYMLTEWDIRREQFRLVKVLGPEFLHKLCVPGLVHITGTNDNDDVVAGTGVVIHPSFVLTCRHVVSDMRIDKKQMFQNKECAVGDDSIHKHEEIDVAIVRVDDHSLIPLKGATLQAPVVAQTVYALGYPKLSGLREASVTMQPGAVTNEAVTSMSGEKLFLYSAISRPGNSGGPVMSEDGYIVGLSTVDATGEYQDEVAFSPHYAGIPAPVVVKAVSDLGLGIDLPYQHFE